MGSTVLVLVVVMLLPHRLLLCPLLCPFQSQLFFQFLIVKVLMVLVPIPLLLWAQIVPTLVSVVTVTVQHPNRPPGKLVPCPLPPMVSIVVTFYHDRRGVWPMKPHVCIPLDCNAVVPDNSMTMVCPIVKPLAGIVMRLVVSVSVLVQKGHPFMIISCRVHNGMGKHYQRRRVRHNY